MECDWIYVHNILNDMCTHMQLSGEKYLKFSIYVPLFSVENQDDLYFFISQSKQS